MTKLTRYILSLSFSLLFLAQSQPAISGEELSFAGFKHSANLTLHGGATIERNGALRLTNHTRRVYGQAFYPEPFRLGLADSFSAWFGFAVEPEYPKLGGHGLTFAISSIQPRPDVLPSQYLGLLNSTTSKHGHVVAVEFDTVRDFEFDDPDDNHVGIDVDSLKSAASAPVSLSLKSGRAIAAWINYDSALKEVTVKLSPLSYQTEPNRTILTCSVDLSRIFLDRPTYVGFTASTGLLASSHYILGWSFKVGGEAKRFDPGSLPSVPSPAKRHGKTIVVPVLVSGFSVLAVVLVFGALFYVVRRVRNGFDPVEEWETRVGPHRFKYGELRRATGGFGEKELIGFGGFGKVYRGTLPGSEPRVVAVKRISGGSGQGLREYASEISSIGRLRHRNLVRLLGWCRRRGDLLLVYEYMENGSLDRFVFGEKDRVLSWGERFKIVKGCGCGLLYLHEEWEQVVIHRDVKAANVLLDSQMSGRLGDFGLAKLYEHGSNPSTTRVVGTLGYLAPELTRTGKPTTASDVFAFGALLLEVVCGRRPVEPKAPPEELILVDWVWDRWRAGAVLEVVDPKLGGVFDEAEVVMVLKLGLMCSNTAPEARPTMRQLVRYLDGEVALPEVVAPPNGCSSGKNGFEDFVHSYPSSLVLERASTLLSGSGDVETGSISSSTILS